MEESEKPLPPQLSMAARRGLYETILKRRDVRSQFLPTPVPHQVLARILLAAHYAPSVGFMQPWNFMIIRQAAVKNAVHELFLQANAEAAEMFAPELRSRYRTLKLEGIRESPINLCITCDRHRAGPTVLGRTHIETMDEYSTVCSVQNLWLAARAEGLGVGWVSIFHPEKLAQTLGIEREVVPVAYLCLGYVSEFLDRPELETAGWRRRLAIDPLVAFEHWRGAATTEEDELLLAELRQQQQSIESGVFLANWESSRDDTNLSPSE